MNVPVSSGIADALRFAAFLFAITNAFGQANLATITGVATDSTDAVVPAVSVKVRNVDTAAVRMILTDASGNFAIPNLPPGNYELLAEHSGFRSYVERAIVLQVGQRRRCDVRMELGSVTESVHVDASIVTINTESGTIKGDVIVQQEIQDLPLAGRDFTDLAFFTPGVVPKAAGGQGSALNVNGARATNTNFYVDGFDDRNARGAAAQTRPNIDALQEFKMEVSGYSAEYGRMAGGIINMVMRSGTNQFHVSLFEYIRNDKFDARGYFDTAKLGFHQNQFGGTILGPLSVPRLYNGHDRTFFIFSSES